MLTKKLAIAAAALLVSLPALANPRWQRDGEWQERRFEHHHYYPHYYYYPPRPVFVVPVYPPAAVTPWISIRLRFPL